MALPALHTGKEAPELSLVCQAESALEAWLSHSQPGDHMPRVESSGEQGRALVLTALLSPVAPGLLFKVLVPSNILCREGGKIYSGNYFLTVW